METCPPAGGSDPAQHLFAYGSLVDPRCLDNVLGHRHRGERLRATLDGFRRVSSTSYPFPFIVEDDGETVDGVLIMELDPCDIGLLDRYEEVDLGVYARRIVDVQAWGCGPRPLRFPAHVYVAGPTLLRVNRNLTEVQRAATTPAQRPPILRQA